MRKVIVGACLCAAVLLLSAGCKRESEEPFPWGTSVDDAFREEGTESTTQLAELPARIETIDSVKYRYIDFYDLNDAAMNPFSLMEAGSSAGGKLIFDEGRMTELSVLCPSWSNDIGNLTMKVFKWDTDYAMTVHAEPLYESTFVDYVDNASLTIAFDENGGEGLEPGAYLWLLCDGVDESGSGVGVWYSGTTANAEIMLFANGEETNVFGWRASARIRLDG